MEHLRPIERIALLEKDFHSLHDQNYKVLDQLAKFEKTLKVYWNQLGIEVNGFKDCVQALEKRIHYLENKI